MLLYLLFFLIQTSLKSNGGKGKLDPTLWMWTVNLIYLALAIVLNLWDTVPVRRLRASFRVKERCDATFGVLDRYIGKTIFTTHRDDAVHAGVAVGHYQSLSIS